MGGVSAQFFRVFVLVLSILVVPLTAQTGLGVVRGLVARQLRGSRPERAGIANGNHKRHHTRRADQCFGYLLLRKRADRTVFAGGRSFRF